MSANFVKRHCYGGWDWCFETDERSSPVSNVVKEYIESIEAENAKLREMLAEDNEELAKMRRVIDYLYPFAKACGVDAGDMCELGVEVNDV